MAARPNIDLSTTTTGATQIFTAAENGHTAVVAQLIAARCNVNLARTIDGVAPFLKATEKGHTVVVNMLIAAHCDVNLRCGYVSQNASLAFSMISRSPCPLNLCP
jgi:hypothetical protein